jgi:Zn finger protein HypA/HybF involved in hydrogenase expression
MGAFGLKSPAVCPIFHRWNKRKERLMEANTTGKVQCTKCNTIYDPVIKVLERVCPQCLSIKTVPLDQNEGALSATV